MVVMHNIGLVNSVLIPRQWKVRLSTDIFSLGIDSIGLGCDIFYIQIDPYILLLWLLVKHSKADAS